MDLGTDKVHQYVLDIATGTLTPHGEVELAPGCGPRGINFHPSLRVAYVNCELDGTCVVCTVDDDKGLVPVQTVHCYPEGFEGRGHRTTSARPISGVPKAAFRPTHPTTTTSAASTRASRYSAVEPDDGQLTFSSRHTLAAHSNARNLALDPSGKYLLVASQDADCVECFRIDPGTGALELVHTQHAPCAADVAVI